MLVAAVTFAVVVMLIVGMYWLFVGRLDQVENAELRKRLKRSAGTVAAPKASRLMQPLQQFSSLSILNTWLTRLGRISEPLQRSITESGLNITVSTLLLAALCLGAASYLIVLLLTFSSLLAIGAGLVALYIPFVVLKQVRT